MSSSNDSNSRYSLLKPNGNFKSWKTFLWANASGHILPLLIPESTIDDAITNGTKIPVPQGYRPQVVKDHNGKQKAKPKSLADYATANADGKMEFNDGFVANYLKYEWNDTVDKARVTLLASLDEQVRLRLQEIWRNFSQPGWDPYDCLQQLQKEYDAEDYTNLSQTLISFWTTTITGDPVTTQGIASAANVQKFLETLQKLTAKLAGTDYAVTARDLTILISTRTRPWNSMTAITHRCDQAMKTKNWPTMESLYADLREYKRAYSVLSGTTITDTSAIVNPSAHYSRASTRKFAASAQREEAERKDVLADHCLHCGLRNHDTNDCIWMKKDKDKICDYCQERGHTMINCAKRLAWSRAHHNHYNNRERRSYDSHHQRRRGSRSRSPSRSPPPASPRSKSSKDRAKDKETASARESEATQPAQRTQQANPTRASVQASTHHASIIEDYDERGDALKLFLPY
jgi:hypothetical protein